MLPQRDDEEGKVDLERRALQRRLQQRPRALLHLNLNLYQRINDQSMCYRWISVYWPGRRSTAPHSVSPRARNERMSYSFTRFRPLAPFRAPKKRIKVNPSVSYLRGLAVEQRLRECVDDGEAEEGELEPQRQLPLDYCSQVLAREELSERSLTRK